MMVILYFHTANSALGNNYHQIQSVHIFIITEMHDIVFVLLLLEMIVTGTNPHTLH